MSITHLKKVLIIHNTYLHKGGEDTVVANEIKCLQRNGYIVFYKEYTNASFKDFTPSTLLLPITIIFNVFSFINLFFFIRLKKIKAVHAHNVFYQASPSVFWAAKLAGAKTINTLHNYRLFCLKATFFRNNNLCFDCSQNKSFKKGIHEKCFKSSSFASSALAFSIFFHEKIGTWQNKIDQYIVVNRFTEKLLLEKNIQAGKIVFKPNFVTNNIYNDYSKRAEFYLFAGRLSEEKGVRHLVKAFTLLQKKLVIAGDGELAEFVKEHTSENIVYMGLKTKEEIQTLSLQCKALIFPSIWIEAMPMTIIEAQSCGTIPIAANLINTSQMIENTIDGFLYDANDVIALVSMINQFELLDKQILNKISYHARQKFINCYSEESHLKKITEIYGF